MDKSTAKTLFAYYTIGHAGKREILFVFILWMLGFWLLIVKGAGSSGAPFGNLYSLSLYFLFSGIATTASAAIPVLKWRSSSIYHAEDTQEIRALKDCMSSSFVTPMRVFFAIYFALVVGLGLSIAIAYKSTSGASLNMVSQDGLLLIASIFCLLVTFLMRVRMAEVFEAIENRVRLAYLLSSLK